MGKPDSKTLLSVINRCIVRDFYLQTGINLVTLPEQINKVLELHGVKLYIPEPTRVALAQLAKNLVTVHKDFLLYDPQSREDPNKIYENLSENRLQFEDALYKGLNAPLLEDPLNHLVQEALNIQFKGLYDGLLKRASVHKFDSDYLITAIFEENVPSKEN